mmetsp:Transcript_5121/g.6515  ORF Transcript_5121/g.6515 Transcript_5121/m.6515 type:complete len:144 (-) Transcript_5121:305-736(-)
MWVGANLETHFVGVYHTKADFKIRSSVNQCFSQKTCLLSNKGKKEKQFFVSDIGVPKRDTSFSPQNAFSFKNSSETLFEKNLFLLLSRSFSFSLGCCLSLVSLFLFLRFMNSSPQEEQFSLKSVYILSYSILLVCYKYGDSLS